MTSDYNLCKCYLSAWVVFPGELKCPQPEFLCQPPGNTGFTDTLGLVTASAATPHLWALEDWDPDYNSSQETNSFFQLLGKSLSPGGFPPPWWFNAHLCHRSTPEPPSAALLFVCFLYVELFNSWLNRFSFPYFKKKVLVKYTPFKCTVQ